MKQNRQNEMLTELVLILDRSGSMHGLEADTIGGFRTMIEKQKAQPGEALVTTVLFNHELRMVHDRLALAQVPPITPAEYEAFGSTALMDAIGTTVEHIANIHRYARPEDVPAHTIFAIITDGMENCSTRYSSREVKRMIRKQQEAGWAFLFIGANIDAVETAACVGIVPDHAANYCADGQGTRVVYEAMSDAVRQMRANVPLAAAWSEPIEADRRRQR